MLLGKLPRHIEHRMNLRSRPLHKLREETRLPKFLNQAKGVRAPDQEHMRVHAYFDRLCTDEQFKKEEAQKIPEKAQGMVRSLTNTRHVQFGISVSALFMQIIDIIRPHTLIATDHEYRGLIECAKTGMLDQQLLTLQMYGLGESERAYRKKVPVTNIEMRADWNALIKRATEIDQKTVVLVSHVSRVDGGVFPIYEIDKQIKKINESRAWGRQVYFVVDGSQAIGSMEVDLTGFDGIYLFSSSKALRAEPGMGVAVGNESCAQLEIIEPILSLPELESLRHMVETTDVPFVSKELMRIKKEATGLIHTVPYLSLPSHTQSSPYMIHFSIPGVDPKVIELAAVQEGFDIYGESNEYAYTTPQYARISFTVDTPWGHIAEFVRFLEGFIHRLAR